MIDDLYDLDNIQERLLYRELIGFCADLPVVQNPHTTTSVEEHWLRLNTVMDEMVALNHPRYAKFKVEPKFGDHNGSRGYLANITTIRMSTKSALEVMGEEFSCGDPAYDLSRYSSSGGVNVSQTANSVNHNTNKQEQKQSQEVTVSLSQSVDAAIRYVRDNHTEEDTKRAEELLEPLKKKNATWAQIEKATQFFLGLGREAFSLVLKILLEHALSK